MWSHWKSLFSPNYSVFTIVSNSLFLKELFSLKKQNKTKLYQIIDCSNGSSTPVGFDFSICYPHGSTPSQMRVCHVPKQGSRQELGSVSCLSAGPEWILSVVWRPLPGLLEILFPSHCWGFGPANGLSSSMLAYSWLCFSRIQSFLLNPNFLQGNLWLINVLKQFFSFICISYKIHGFSNFWKIALG
jgi:hypothetical protein